MNPEMISMIHRCLQEGYQVLILTNAMRSNPSKTVLFTEIDKASNVPQISTACWDILNKTQNAMMCSSSWMVVKRKGDTTPRVIAFILSPYEPELNLLKH